MSGREMENAEKSGSFSGQLVDEQIVQETKE